ncbi:MAG: metalloregulator ArsR/SmtB family transcription factor [Candidatus Wallbacteria bacterium]|nr:metalloregulator ArsR/SmtB family transcription factor [Candidatus Wallbacteria bacterium]
MTDSGDLNKNRARVLKALAHPTRLFLVEKLNEGECCVCKLVEHINADFSTVSRHLAVLKNAGILEDEKRGQLVFYRLRCPCVLKFIKCIEEAVRTLKPKRKKQAGKVAGEE